MDSAFSSLDNPVPEPAEPCPTPLSTVEVFQAFDEDSESWTIETQAGAVRGQTIGEGPSLYFLKGLEGSSQWFRLLAWLLREEFRCVLYDGSVTKSDFQQPMKKPAELPEVRQLLAVADHFGDDSITVYGSGFGAWLAVAGMLTEPRRFRAAVLQGAYVSKSLKLMERCLLPLARKSKRSWQAVPGWSTIFEQNHRRWFPPFDAVRWEIFRQTAGEVPVCELAWRIGQMRNVSLQDSLGEIATPILHLHSEGEGRVAQQNQTELQQALPQARTEWLQDTGRVPHWTHPHRVAKLIRQQAAELNEAEQPANTLS